MPRDKNIRVDPIFEEELCDIKRRRIALGFDRPHRPISTKRITRGIIRESDWNIIKDKLIRKPRDWNLDRRGAVTDIFFWILIGFAMFILAGVIIYNFGIVTNAVVSIPVTNAVTDNLHNSSVLTLGSFNTIVQSLRYWTVIIFVAIALSILVSNFLIRIHPAFFVLYIILMAIGVVFSIFVSNAYSTFLETSGTLQSTYQSFSGMGYLMLHLPVFVTVFGFLGGIFLFIGINRDDEAGGSFIQ